MLPNLREYFLYESQKEGWDALAAQIEKEWLDNFIDARKETSEL